MKLSKQSQGGAKNMAKETYRVYSRIVRKYNDPIYYETLGIRYWNLLCDIKKLYRTTKGEIIYEANPREHEENNPPNNSVVKAIKNEFLEGGNQFHLKNSGITIIATNVEDLGNDEIKITVDKDKGGITNGGTTYRQLMKVCKDNDLSSLPDHQYVKIMIMEKIPSDWIADISGSLNTHAKVNESAIMNLDNKLDFIKNTLSKQDWGKHIAYKQHEPGEWTIDKVIAVMNLFDVIEYGPDTVTQPVQSYSSKTAVIKKLSERLKKNDQETRKENFVLMTPILNEILILHDIIRDEFSNYIKKFTKKADKGYYVLNGKDSKGNKISNKYFLPTLNKKVDYDLSESALYPILAAFRVCIEHTNTNDYMQWRVSFNKVKEIWRSSAKKMLSEIHEVYESSNYNVRAIGITKDAWLSCYMIVDRELRKIQNI